MGEMMATRWFFVPNAPCGVESRNACYRVLQLSPVPNAPCGVESLEDNIWQGIYGPVPNAPCGVESYKGLNFILPRNLPLVPNAPCGVES